MKILCLALLSSAPALLAAPLPLANAFNNSTLAAPPQSLAEASAALAPDAIRPASPRPDRGDFWTQRERGRLEASKPSVRGSITMLGSMPVMRPDPSVDYKLIIKAGDPSIDPKILNEVGPPETEGK